jgi:hypothetical protein
MFFKQLPVEMFTLILGFLNICETQQLLKVFIYHDWRLNSKHAITLLQIQLKKKMKKRMMLSWFQSHHNLVPNTRRVPKMHLYNKYFGNTDSARRIHPIIGPTASGKTTWIFKEIHNYLLPFFSKCYFCSFMHRHFIATIPFNDCFEFISNGHEFDEKITNGSPIETNALYVFDYEFETSSQLFNERLSELKHVLRQNNSHLIITRYRGDFSLGMRENFGIYMTSSQRGSFNNSETQLRQLTNNLRLHHRHQFIICDYVASQQQNSLTYALNPPFIRSQ